MPEEEEDEDEDEEEAPEMPKEGFRFWVYLGGRQVGLFTIDIAEEAVIARALTSHGGSPSD